MFVTKKEDEDFEVDLVATRTEHDFDVRSELLTGEGVIIFDGPTSTVSEGDFGTDWMNAVADAHEAFLLSTLEYLIRNTV